MARYGNDYGNWLYRRLHCFFKFVSPELSNVEHWLLGISPEGIGSMGMIINIAVSVIGYRLSVIVTLMMPKPPEETQQFVEDIRAPIGTGKAHELSA